MATAKAASTDYDWLSPQEKLALSMTTARSMRGLAAALGVTHQKLGRWLREGENGGVKSIPTDPETTAAIDTVFEAHRDIARAQAAVTEIPFDEELPVFAERKKLRSGKTGDRVIVHNTQFIRPKTRQDILYFMHETERYYTASVRSVIELATYMQEADERAGRKKRDRTDAQWQYYAQLLLAENDGEEYRPVYTRAEGFGPWTSRQNAVKSVETLIRQRHEPATGERRTALADEYLFQLIPANYVHRKRKPRESSDSKRRPKAKGGRGNK